MGFSRIVSPSQMLGGFVGLVIAGFVVRSFLAGGIEEYFNPTKRTENAIVAALEKQPGQLALMQAMERQFPADYDNFLDTMTAAATSGREDDIVRDGNAFLDRFTAAHAGDYANAPDALLLKVVEAESRLLASLAARSQADCADYVFGTLEPDIPLSAESNRLLGESAAAKINAISGGRTQQQIRLGVTPIEGRALVSAMKARGATDAQMAAMRGEIDPDTLSAKDQCGAGIHMVEAIRVQPPEVAALLASDLLGPER